MILLLDTTVLIDVLRAKHNRCALLADLVSSGHTLATAALNIAEVYAGMRPGEEEKTEGFLSDLHCYPMEGNIGRRAGALKAEFARRGQTFALADMIVAATVIEHQLTLMTDNRKHFPIPEIRFFPL